MSTKTFKAVPNCNQAIQVPQAALKYVHLLNRVKSFEGPLVKNNFKWTKFFTPRRLALAGFFYFDVDDKVACFSCLIILGQWAVCDDPFFEHVYHKGTSCDYIRQEGRKYCTLGVQPNIAFTPVSLGFQATVDNEVHLMTKRLQDAEDRLEAYKCCVCLVNCSTQLMIPCNHLSICAPCLIKNEAEDSNRPAAVQKCCVVCRKKYTGTMTIFRT